MVIFNVCSLGLEVAQKTPNCALKLKKLKYTDFMLILFAGVYLGIKLKELVFLKIMLITVS
jgi:hypothetical protein